ncbi:MAG: CYTH domain-containing protein [marine bacterium B5-7]|nr:MAG: CYTH domain-containing protein [marine bacterium B5-7]
MAIEIERKFLISNNDWRHDADEGIQITQGYMGSNKKSSVRIRVNGETANINIKSMTIGTQRSEYEYAIPLDEANEMLAALCDRPYIDKTRYHVNHQGHVWEVDVFAGENEGLVVAEIELTNVNETFTLPNWVGEEVTEDPRYYNICLVNHPYKSW